MAANAAGGSTLDWVTPMMIDKFIGPNSGRLLFAVSCSTAAILGVNQLAPGQEAKKDVLAAAKGTVLSTNVKTKAGKADAKAQKVAVNKAFIRQFLRLLRVAFPSIQSTQGTYLASLSVLLLLRTWLSIKTTAAMGNIATKMVQAEFKPIAMGILQLASWAIPASAVNSGLRYTSSLLQLSFRKNLTRHFHTKYLSQKNFFKSVGLGAVDSVDQRITSDVQKFSDEAAEIYSTLFKPIIDIFLFSTKVSEYAGWRGPALIIAYYGMITFVIRALAPNFGLLTSIQQQREGKLRTAHNRVIEYAEEVTMSQGEARSLSTLNGLFNKAYVHYLYTAFLKAHNNLLDGILVKYGSVMAGYAVCGLSIFSEEASKMDSSALTGLYIHTSQLLVNLARAIGQLIMTYKTVASLAGYTHRVSQLDDGLALVDKERRQAEKNEEKSGYSQKTATGGEVISGQQGIAFKNVPVISPDNTTLISSMNFHVNPGMNLLIIGPNGCGKSSTFRLLGELWPLHGGTIEKPSFEHLYYVPQRPYMSAGTLRDQVIYPTRAKEAKVGDADLFECLKRARLDSLLDQPGIEWDARLNWAGEALSQGQKQKLAMARLFFHRPRFAILDECTSAIDVDIEQHLYSQCKELGISLITIAHRRSLWKYHNWVLRFDGDKGYMFSPLSFKEKQDMILTKVMHSSDESKIGQTVTIDTTKSENRRPEEMGKGVQQQASSTTLAPTPASVVEQKKVEQEESKEESEVPPPAPAVVSTPLEEEQPKETTTAAATAAEPELDEDVVPVVDSNQDDEPVVAPSAAVEEEKEVAAPTPAPVHQPEPEVKTEVEDPTPIEAATPEEDGEGKEASPAPTESSEAPSPQQTKEREASPAPGHPPRRGKGGKKGKKH